MVLLVEMVGWVVWSGIVGAMSGTVEWDIGLIAMVMAVGSW